jgi:Tol biopolymer transport system component
MKQWTSMLVAVAVLMPVWGMPEETALPAPPPLTGRIAFRRTTSLATASTRAAGAYPLRHSLGIFDLVTNRETIVEQVDATTEESPPFYELAWAPDGASITFVRQVPDRQGPWYGRAQIHSIDTDGSGTEILFPSDEHDRLPAWSRDWLLAYVHHSGGGDPGPIWVNGSLFVECGCFDRPAWSPDGTTLIISHLGWLYRVRVSDRSVDRISDSGYSGRPAFSPDGRRIAFSKWSGGTQGEYQLWVMNADGTSPRRLTGGSPHDSDPAWSPDGSYIAFARGTGVFELGYSWNILLMNADGSGLRTIIEGGEDPAWAP